MEERSGCGRMGREAGRIRVLSATHSVPLSPSTQKKKIILEMTVN